MKKYLIAILFLASCSNIPTSGPINPGIEIDAIDPGVAVNVIPQAPRNGMTQQEVVAGFLAAHANAAGDFTIAREYLAEFVAAEWVPSAGVQVFETAFDLQATNENTITAVGIPKLTLDDQLRPSLIAGASTSSISFSFTQENGEWRITNPPVGLILTNADFQRNFEIAKLWFVDRGLERLVPDFIAISQRNDPAAQLIRALTNGSNNWLTPAVTNFLDPARSGGIAAVQRNGELIIIDLEAQTLRLSSREQSWLVSQLAQTLLPISGIAELSVTVGGQLLIGPGFSNPIDLAQGSWLAKRSSQITNQYAIGQGGRLIQPGNQVVVRSWLERLPNPDSLAVAGDEQQIAVAIPERAEIAVGNRAQTPRIISQVSAVSDLNFDTNGKLWFLNRNSRIWFGFDGAELLRVNVPVPASSTLNHVMIAPDSIRVAIISESGPVSTLAIARLVSTDRGVSLKDDRAILTLTGEVRSLSWYSATEVVLLVKFPNQTEPVAVIVDLATAAQTIIRLPVKVQQLDANGFGTMMVIDQANRIWQRSTGAWEEIGTGRVATYPRR